MKKFPPSVGPLQSFATLIAGVYFVIVSAIALLKLALYGEFQFPLTRFHGPTVVYYVDEPLRTATWALVTLALGIVGLFLVYVSFPNVRRWWQS